MKSAGGLLVLIVLLTACADDPELPREYSGEFPQIREGQPGQGGEVVLGTVLSAEGGTEAEIAVTFIDSPPEEAESVECGGQNYDDVGRLDQSSDAHGSLDIRDFGSASLDIERNVAAVPLDEPGPPLCDEWEGTWRGTDGDLEDRTGTFLLVGMHEGDTMRATLTLEEK